MPIDYRLYPADWRQVRASILARAGNRCEWCGAPNGAEILRASGGRRCIPAMAVQWHDRHGQPCPAPAEHEMVRPARVVLTIAHVHNPDPMDCRPENLAALCQACHLRHDARLHARRSAATRRRRRTAGQTALLIGGEDEP